MAREREPVVLPAQVPNLLVNGAGGIAVGMATNIPPHNLGEVVDACALIGPLWTNPDIAPDDLLDIVPGPDFPTGGDDHGPHRRAPGLRDRARLGHHARQGHDRGDLARTARRSSSPRSRSR